MAMVIVTTWAAVGFRMGVILGAGEGFVNGIRAALSY
jgi:hypothetical protein